MTRHRWRSAFEFARVFVAMDEVGIKVSILLQANGFIRPLADSYRAALEAGDADVRDIPDSLRRRHFGTQAGVALSAVRVTRPVGLLLDLTTPSATPT